MAGAGMVKFFMDDGNLAGTFEATMAAFQVIREEGHKYGYHIKWKAARYMMAKCDHQEAIRRADALIALGFSPANVIIHPDSLLSAPSTYATTCGVSVLGSFIGRPEYVRARLEAKQAEWDNEAAQLFKVTDLQTRFMLLTWCFKSKSHYWLRTTQADHLADLTVKFDATKRRIMESILQPSCRAPQDNLSDIDWKICQLNVSCGGLGLELSANVQHAATLAAAVAVGPSLSIVGNLTDRFFAPLSPQEPASVVRDFHQALATFTAIQPDLCWQKLTRMNKGGGLQHKLSAMLHKHTQGTIMANPGANNLKKPACGCRFTAPRDSKWLMMCSQRSWRIVCTSTNPCCYQTVTASASRTVSWSIPELII